MQSLFDVFTAICADEGDHVSTMAACSDPAANLRSPSLERRILTGVAVFAVSSYLLTTTGILDAGILDSASDAALATADTTLAELAAAGMAGFVERIMNDEESRAVGADLLEGGDGAAAVLEQLQRLAAQFGEFIARIL